ncbi:transcriptional regulator GutM [Megamonas funiformis]|uniref:transcriptional regulator GutM n=1 Tax=Megamonas funiformis TaxID=437897 RepID=UPI00241CBAEB|nr:transcriptional regulator GutM [Megamonas funiformis]
MMDFTMLFVCLLAFMVIQALGTYVQVQQYKKAVRRLHKKGNIGIGSKRSRIRNNIVIIACDNQGKIVDGELMEGLTVFTKFKQIPDIIGKDIFLLKEEYEALSKKEKKQIKGHLQAVEALCNRLSSIENT